MTHGSVRVGLGRQFGPSKPQLPKPGPKNFLNPNPKLLMSVRKSSKFDSIISCLELGFRFHTGGTG